MRRSKILASALAASFTVAGCSVFSARSGGGDEPEIARTTPETLPALDRGKAHFAEGNYGLALQAFMGALATQGDSVDALNAIGASYDRLGRHDLARKYYERALAAAPSHSQTLNNLGYSMVLQGNYEAALDYFRLAKTERMNPLLDANIAMAQRLAQRRQANAQLPMAAPQMAAAPITSALRHDGPRIERTSPFVHTLVTKPKMETQLAVLPRDTTPKVVHTPQPAIPAELTHGFSMAPLVPQAPVTGAEIGVADGAPTPLLPLDMMAAATPPSRTPPLPAPPTDTLAPVAPPSEALAPLADTTPPTAESRTAESPAAALAADPLPAQAAVDPAASDAEIEAAMAAVISENPAPSNDLAPIVTNNTEPSGELALHEWPDPDGSTVVGAPATAMRRVPTIPPAAAPDAANTPRAEKAPRVVRDAIPAPAAADSHSASNNWPSDAHPGDEREAAIAAAASGIVVEISNGAGRDRMATRFRSYLQARGFANLRVSNDKSFRNHATVVYYREGYREAADLVARELPFSATLERADDLTVHVRVLLGGDFLEWDRRQLITGLALQSPGQDVANLN